MGVEKCGTNGRCDAQGDACALYPAGTISGTASTCEEPGMRTTMQCELGCCEHVLAPCPGNFVCADEESCMERVRDGRRLRAPGRRVHAERVRPARRRAVDSDAQCASTVCGTTGSGHCCSAACDPVAAPCGATDCDSRGARDFRPRRAARTPSCMGSAIAERCWRDERGACPGHAGDAACPGHLVCEDALGCSRDVWLEQQHRRCALHPGPLV